MSAEATFPDKPARVSYALISVYDKTGIVEFCRELKSLGIELLSTGGTAELLAENHIETREVSDYTDFPEIMDGRVKTLHPRIHGGLLGRPGKDSVIMERHGIVPIGLLAVNLYPFERVAAKPEASLAEIIEYIDIGGPCMIRAAAKNHDSVGVVVEPDDYPRILHELHGNDCYLEPGLRAALARKAFAHTAQYDSAISNFLHSAGDGEDGFPDVYSMQFYKRAGLRYGENPQQQAALYGPRKPLPGSLCDSRLLQGKLLSYNNLADADTAWRCAGGFTVPACAIVKHYSPCGVAMADNAVEAYKLAYRTDPVSAFGGVLAFNRRVEASLAEAIITQQFAELIIAPSISREAMARFADKPDLRLVELGEESPGKERQLELRRIDGGLLVQEEDRGVTPPADSLEPVGRHRPTPEQFDDLLFAWRVARHVRSNAIVLARGGSTIGIGAGQMSRVDSVRIAIMKALEAGLELQDAVLASDGFFPFPDGVELAADAGVRAIIQPGGSKQDAKVIAAADRQDVAMVLTGVRHFRH